MPCCCRLFGLRAFPPRPPSHKTGTTGAWMSSTRQTASSKASMPPTPPPTTGEETCWGRMSSLRNKATGSTSMTERANACSICGQCSITAASSSVTGSTSAPPVPGVFSAPAPRRSEPRRPSHRDRPRRQARRSRVPASPLHRHRRTRQTYDVTVLSPCRDCHHGRVIASPHPCCWMAAPGLSSVGARSLWPRKHGFSFVAASVNANVLKVRE